MSTVGEAVQQVQVRVPATSANMGPGFDCLGLALGLYMDVVVAAEEGEGLEIVALGEGRGVVPHNERNAVYQGVAKAYAAAGQTPGRLKLEIASQIPLASGLGSSSAALVAGLAAGTALCGVELDREELLRQGVAVEGHPDNVAPCVMGGVVIAALDGEQVTWARIDPPTDLVAVVAVPDFPLRTSVARQVLPERIDRAAAVFNMGRVGLLVAAFMRGDYDLLRQGMRDRLHQPQREALVPGMAAVLQGQQAVAQAMRETWANEGVEARTMVLPLEAEGVRLERGTR